MKSSSRFAAIAFMACLTAAPLMARTPVRQIARDSVMNDHRIILMGNESKGIPAPESQRKLIEQFYINQFENTRQPDADRKSVV